MASHSNLGILDFRSRKYDFPSPKKRGISTVRPAPLWLFSEFSAVYKYSDLLTYLLTVPYHSFCRSEVKLTGLKGQISTLCSIRSTHISHIVESCPLTKLNGGLSRLHSADEDAVSWLTNYGKWHAYEKKKNAYLTAALSMQWVLWPWQWSSRWPWRSIGYQISVVCPRASIGVHRFCTLYLL